MARPLVKTHIRGFDEDVLRGGIPQGHVVLVRGASGTMKSSLAYYVLYHNALAGSPGLYVTLEQTAAGLLEHVAGLGLRPPPFPRHSRFSISVAAGNIWRRWSRRSGRCRRTRLRGA